MSRLNQPFYLMHCYTISSCTRVKEPMKDTELKLISELMKNSRRSDRELAKAIDSTQPTVTRMRRKLEKSGIIKEYTMIPDFNKLGYKLCSITLASFREPSDVESLRKAIEIYGHRLSEIPQAVVIERGMGVGANGVVIAFHSDYSSFLDFEKWLKQFSFLPCRAAQPSSRSSSVSMIQSRIVDIWPFNFLQHASISSFRIMMDK